MYTAQKFEKMKKNNFMGLSLNFINKEEIVAQTVKNGLEGGNKQIFEFRRGISFAKSKTKLRRREKTKGRK